MWKSYHIYNVDYLNFIDEVSILKKNYFDYQSSFFFTVYADFKGIHYRLRIKEEFIEEIELLEENMNKFFGKLNIEKRIYDPEIIKYGNNLEAYETFSSLISEYLISIPGKTNDKLFSGQEVLQFMKIILEHFDVYDDIQIYKSIKFWEETKKFYRSTITKEVYGNLQFNKNNILQISDVINIIDTKSIEERREMCFNFIHLTINRFNFNIKDECLLYYKLFELKREAI